MEVIGMTLHEELEQAKQLEREAFEAAKNVEEPFDRKIEDFQKRIDDLKMQRIYASKNAWNKHHTARLKTSAVHEKIFQDRQERAKRRQ